MTKDFIAVPIILSGLIGTSSCINNNRIGGGTNPGNGTYYNNVKEVVTDLRTDESSCPVCRGWIDEIQSVNSVINSVSAGPYKEILFTSKNNEMDTLKATIIHGENRIDAFNRVKGKMDVLTISRIHNNSERVLHIAREITK